MVEVCFIVAPVFSAKTVVNLLHDYGGRCSRVFVPDHFSGGRLFSGVKSWLTLPDLIDRWPSLSSAVPPAWGTLVSGFPLRSVNDSLVLLESASKFSDFEFSFGAGAPPDCAVTGVGLPSCDELVSFVSEFSERSGCFDVPVATDSVSRAARFAAEGFSLVTAGRITDDFMLGAECAGAVISSYRAAGGSGQMTVLGPAADVVSDEALLGRVCDVYSAAGADRLVLWAPECVPHMADLSVMFPA